MKEVLTPKNIAWSDFIEKLDFALAHKPCTHSYEITTNILRAYFTQIDIAKTIKYFEENGGYCDCEVRWNIDPWEKKND